MTELNLAGGAAILTDSRNTRVQKSLESGLRSGVWHAYSKTWSHATHRRSTDRGAELKCCGGPIYDLH